jgi:hypothetical protein
MVSRSGKVEPHAWQWKEGNQPAAGGYIQFFQAQDAQKLPHEQFERWAKSFMTTAAADPSHPDHEDAKKLLKIQPLRSSGHVTGRVEATPQSLEEHFNSITPYSVSAEDIEEANSKLNKNKPIAEPVQPDREVPEAPTQAAGSQPASPAQLPAPASAAKSPASVELDQSDLEEIEAPKPKPKVSPPPIPVAPPKPPNRSASPEAEPAEASADEEEYMDEEEFEQERSKFVKDKINAIFSQRAGRR